MLEDIFLVMFSSLFEITFYMIIIVVILNKVFRTIIRIINRKFFKENVVYNYGDNKHRYYTDVTSDKLEMFKVNDINVLKDFFYNMFLDFEKAYNNLDYNTMRILSTTQVFNNYYTGISLDLKAGKKRIITDIERKKVTIFGLDSTIARQTAQVMIEISYINCMVDQNGYVISGNRNKKTTERFEVTFRKIFEKETITKCPNCGAEIVGNKCEYCRSTLKNVEFKISDIKKIINKK